MQQTLTVWQWIAGVLATVSAGLLVYALKRRNTFTDQGADAMGRVEVLESRVGGLDGRVDDLEVRQGAVETRMARGDERFKNIQAALAEVKAATKDMRHDVQRLTGEVAGLAAQLSILPDQDGRGKR